MQGDTLAVRIKGCSGDPVSEVCVGFDFMVEFTTTFAIEQGDWIGIYLVTQSDSEWGQHWYGVKDTNPIIWSASYGPWVEGDYHFRYFRKDRWREGPVATSLAFPFSAFPESIFSMYTKRKHVVDDSSVSVMTFNCWDSGSNVRHGIQGLAHVILHESPDVVALQELGYLGFQILSSFLPEYKFTTHSSTSGADWSSGAIISKYPVEIINLQKQTSNSIWGFAAIITLPYCQIRLINSHLTAYPYAPYEINRKGKSVAEVLCQAEDIQLTDIKEIVSHCLTDGEKYIDLICGDHNIPSHIDGQVVTEEMCRNRIAWPFTVSNEPVEWPVSKWLFQKGFLDSYRELFPNVGDESGDGAVFGGFTYSPKLFENEIHDRIDYIYFKNGFNCYQHLIPTNAVLVDRCYASHLSYPSDHRALKISFVITNTK